MKKIAIVVKPDSNAKKMATKLSTWLKLRNIDVLNKDVLPPENKDSSINLSIAPPDLFCVFVLGGDGSFLSAARWINGQNIPLIGIKFGEVGFLAETSADDLFKTADYIINNKFKTTARMQLQVIVERNSKKIADETVLNDIVINKGALARLARIKTYVDDHFLTTYRADGLIVSTPTGSTAYSLAAGGPVIHPYVQGLIMTPICPFTLTNRPLILPDSFCIKIRLEKGSSDIMLTFDGQKGFEIDEKDTIIIKKSPFSVHMIIMPDVKYFDVLKAKLRWSGSRY